MVPPLLAGLVDDAAVFPPGNAALADAIAGHRRYRSAGFADLVGPLLLPSAALTEVAGLLGADERLSIGVIGTPGQPVAATLAGLDARLAPRQWEVAVAKRGEDPQPGLYALLDQARAELDRHADLALYVELPLTWGLSGALDTVASARADGVRVAPKFRTGGLVAELFPRPNELAGVICACRDRDLPFKLTAGLHHAIRHTDPATSFTHHGFVNILAAVVAAAAGADPVAVTGWLTETDPAALAGVLKPDLGRPRPLWIGFGTCSVLEPLADLRELGLLPPEAA
ncbi:MAG TPA: hypothetical protein VF163_11530 [Micromonosporaceae bacterium]